MMPRILLTAALACSAASAAGAQSIADRVARAADGSIRMTFATKPEVCGRGGNIQRGGDRHGNFSSGGWDRNRDVEWDAMCDYGPGRLVLEKRDGELVSLRFYVGGRWRRERRAGSVATRSSPRPSRTARRCGRR